MNSAKDFRQGHGAPYDAIEQATLTIPCDCACTWIVIAPGPGMACRSRLTYRSSLCAHLRDHERHRRTPTTIDYFRPGVA